MESTAVAERRERVAVRSWADLLPQIVAAARAHRAHPEAIAQAVYDALDGTGRRTLGAPPPLITLGLRAGEWPWPPATWRSPLQEAGEAALRRARWS